jgi:hypothetical protein
MKTYKDIQEINKDLKPLGMRINEKWEILCKFEDGKEKKVGNLRFATEEEERKTDMIEMVEKKLKAKRKNNKNKYIEVEK